MSFFLSAEMAVTLKILLWKNFKTEKRMWYHFIGEILSIVLLGMLVIATPTYLEEFALTENQRKSIKIYAPDILHNLSILRKIYEDTNFPSHLAYTPLKSYTNDITTGVAETLELKPTNRYVPNNCLAKITYADSVNNSDEIPMNLTVSITFPGKFRTFKSGRIESNLWLSRCTGKLMTSMEDSPHEMQTDLYIREGFLQIQHLTFLQWLKELDGMNHEIIVNVQSFAYDTPHRFYKLNNLSNALAILYHFMFFLPFLNLLWKYGRECEENILAHHWRYGCSKWKYWGSHFVASFIHFLLLDVLVLVLTIISWKTKSQSSDTLSIAYLAAILLLTACEFIITAMLIVCLIPYAVNAVYVGMLVWILLYAVFATILEFSDKVKSAGRMFSLIISFNNDFALSMRYLSHRDKESNNENAAFNENMTYLFGAIGASIVLKFIFLVLVQYLKPGRYHERKKGSAKKEKAVSFKKKKRSVEIPELDDANESNIAGPMYASRSVVISKMDKSIIKFRDIHNKVRLRKINIMTYNGEITVIWGHSSSGKTTLAALLAGWQNPTNGSIEFKDKTMACDKNVLCKADICMPNNPLFDYLTAFETLVYFINIKGKYKSRKQFNQEGKYWLTTVKPVFKHGEEITRLVKDMTFEQKRILFLCCVLSCDTKVVILDEPTGHMRVHEQRFYWSILKREKSNRSIIVTTKSLREAETIGDRLAFLIDGRIAAYGTLMFLRTSFGIGFNLIIFKKPKALSEPITSFLREFVPKIKLDVETNSQLVYKVPDDKRPVFQIMLIQLQKRYEDFGITDSRILTADLTDVIFFLAKTNNTQKIPNTPQALTVDFLPKKKRVKQQWSAMFYKRLAHQSSSLIPLMMCIASIVLISLTMHLLNDLRRTEVHTITVGFNDTKSLQILGNVKECPLIGIQSVKSERMLGTDTANSFIFTKDSLMCSNMTFENYVKNATEMGHKYGALSVVDKNKYTLYVNQQIFHSAPLVLNLLHNFILDDLFKSNPNYMIKILNDPIHIPVPDAKTFLQTEIEYLYVPLSVGVILPITLCTFIIPIVDDRNSNALMLMSIAGLRIDIYWLVNFIWDWLTFLAYSIAFEIIMIALYFKEIRFTDVFIMLLIINIYSVPLLASIYLSSMIYQQSRYRVYLVACLFHCVSGLFAFIFFWNVLLAQPWYLYTLLMFPSFAMLDGLSHTFVLSKFFKRCSQFCSEHELCKKEKICDSIAVCCEFSFFEWKNCGILRSLVFLLISTVIIFLLIFWAEIHNRESKFLVTPGIKQLFTKTSPNDDPDISQMRERIAASDLREIGKKRIVVDQVERQIPPHNLALSTISFDVEKNSCLAVYGTDCVGKSHLCRQIVGQTGFNFGDVYIRGIPLKYNIHEAWTHMGYTPQELGILTRFAVIEILHFFCLIRGVPKGAIRTVVSDASALFGLEKVMHKKIDHLTKGQQRKVYIAVALMATNKVMVLDEPTTGLPTWTCREIWKALRYLCTCGKSIMLTTTSMYECDAVADIVLLIDDENMLGYGSSYFLRGKHIGFHLEVKLRREGQTLEEVEENFRVDVENLHRFMIFMHSGAVLISQLDNNLKFYLPVEKISFNILYGSLERNRNRLNIIEYTVSQLTFEEILKMIMDEHERKT